MSAPPTATAITEVNELRQVPPPASRSTVDALLARLTAPDSRTALRPRADPAFDAAAEVEEGYLAPLRAALLTGDTTGAIELLLTWSLACEGEILAIRLLKLQSSLGYASPGFGEYDDPCFHVNAEALHRVRQSEEHVSKMSLSLARFKAITAARELTEARTESVLEANSAMPDPSTSDGP